MHVENAAVIETPVSFQDIFVSGKMLLYAEKFSYREYKISFNKPLRLQ